MTETICDITLRGTVGDEQYNDLVKRVDEIVEKLRRSDPTTPIGVHYGTAAERVAAEEVGRAANYRQQLITQGEALQGMTGVLDGFVSTGSSPEAAFRQTMGSVGDSSIAAAERARGKFVSDVEREGLMPYFHTLSKNDTSAEAFMSELQQLNMKEGKPGVSKNPSASKLAKLFQTHVDAYRAQMRALGFKVASLEGRMLKQVWDSDRMLQAVKNGDEFAEVLFPRLKRIGEDPIENFTPDEAKKILKEFYDLKTGRTVEQVELSSRNMILERQTYAVRQAQARELHFRTPADSLFVLKEFGAGDVGALMAETIRDLGKQVDLTVNMGVNPRANMYSLIGHAVKRGGKKTSIERGGWTLAQTPENLMNTIDGFYNNNSSNPTLSELSDTLHNFARSSMLSMASISAIGDFPTLSAAQRRLGIEYGTRLAARTKAMFNDMSPEVMREAAGLVETMGVHALGTAHRYITLPGINHKLYNASVWAADKTFDLNGLNYMTRKNKQSAYLGYSNLLAKQVGERTPYAQLDNYAKRTLLRGGVTQKEWDELLQATDAVFTDGNLRVMNLGALSPRLAGKVNAALSAFVNEAVITPNTQARTMMTLGTQRGTAANAIISQMSFLLGYPIAFVGQGFSRQIEATGFRSFGMLRYVAALTMAGVVTTVVKDIAKGRDRDYSNPEIMLQVLQEGMIAGGGMTIYGEQLWKLAGADRGVHHLFFGDSSKYRIPPNRPFELKDLFVGGGVEYGAKAAAGVTKGVYQLITGDADAAATLAKTAKATLPFTNLPGVKPMLDATLWDYFLSLSDPHTMDKAERRWHARTGGDFFLTDFNP